MYNSTSLSDDINDGKDSQFAALHVDGVGIGINPEDSVGGVIIRNSQDVTSDVLRLRFPRVTSDPNKAVSIGHPDLFLGACQTTSDTVYASRKLFIISYTHCLLSKHF